MNAFLAGIETLALDLANRGTTVVAHSDHGLIRTTHSVDVEKAFKETEQKFSIQVGGAGRFRWLDAGDGESSEVAAFMRVMLPRDVGIYSRSRFFSPGSSSFDSVGNVVVVAEGEKFLSSTQYRYEHGSFARSELVVPLALWDSI